MTNTSRVTKKRQKYVGKLVLNFLRSEKFPITYLRSGSNYEFRYSEIIGHLPDRGPVVLKIKIKKTK